MFTSSGLAIRYQRSQPLLQPGESRDQRHGRQPQHFIFSPTASCIFYLASNIQHPISNTQHPTPFPIIQPTLPSSISHKPLPTVPTSDINLRSATTHQKCLFKSPPNPLPKLKRSSDLRLHPSSLPISSSTLHLAPTARAGVVTVETQRTSSTGSLRTARTWSRLSTPDNPPSQCHLPKHHCHDLEATR